METPDRAGRAWHAAVSARGRALLAGAEGDFEAAREEVERALRAHERLPQPFERGRTLLAQGTIERRAKRRAAAREGLTAALSLFDALGAGLWAGQAAAELARIPGRGRASGELTETERHVADALSNKEVATRLFVSVRAVEANLSKVYAKLGVRWYRGRKLIASGRHRFTAAGVATIVVKLTATGRKQLRPGRRVAVMAKGTFTPAPGSPVTASRAFTLKR